MQQPEADYLAGLYPTWADCLNWQNGAPPEPYTWSYGASVTTTTSTTTTSSTTTTTTSSSTTTTVVETTTTSSSTTTTSSSTTVQETTTSWEPTTTSTIPTTTSTTTVVQTTVPVTTTTTSLPVPTATTTTTEAPVSTTTTQPEEEERGSEGTQETTSPTNEPLPESTIDESETTVDESDTTVEETSTTDLPDLPEEPVETVPDETVPDETFPEDVLDETNAPEVEEEPEEYTPDTTEVEELYSSSTTLPDIPVDEPVTDEQIEEILDALVEAEPKQIAAVISQLLAAEITSDQATEIASSPEVLAAITQDQAEQLFEQIEVNELTKEQLEQFTEAIQEAPTKVRKAFEKTINIFGSQFEDYVPTGSSIPVKTRRTLVAAGALIAAMPSTRIRR